MPDALATIIARLGDCPRTELAIELCTVNRSDVRMDGKVQYLPRGRIVEDAQLELAEKVESEDKRIDMSVCNKRCPACVEFTTVFQMPKMEYMGCLRKQSDSNTLNNRHDAPLGQPCPFYAACEYEEAGDE